MNYLLVLCLIYVGISTTWGQTETRGPKWGDISGPYLFQERVSKGKIPLFTRSTTIEYPLIDKQSPEGAAKSLPPLLRGIEHVNLVDKEKTGCDDPDVELVEGGAYSPLAKIKVTSKRGCPLDSVIYFYASN